jgi:putative transposase
VKSYQATFKASVLCKALGVSTSGYYAWLKRPPSLRRQSDILLADRLEALHRRSRSTYGRPRLQADLRDEGLRVSDNA